MATNIITADFSGRGHIINLEETLWQYDYGQILRIVGLDLPEYYEVHFSNQPQSGEALTYVVSGEYVNIPNSVLTSGCIIYVYIWLTSGSNDGETEYRIIIPVRKRPVPEDLETPEDPRLLDNLISQMNEAIERSETAADSSEDSAENASNSADAAAQSAQAAAQSEANAKASEEAAAQSATEALAGAYTSTQKAREASESASASAASASAANTSADRAEQAARDAGYMFFYIDENGDLIYQRTTNVSVDFYMNDGDLYVRAAG